MINAGKNSKKISIYKIVSGKDGQGFPTETKVLVAQPYAFVKTTKGFTLIANNSDFEKAYTNFTIRYSPKVVDAYYNSLHSNRFMVIEFNNKEYSVNYLNNIDENNVELEMQCEEIME